MHSINKRYPKPLFLFLSFLEGGAVMIVELVSAKLLAPYFGTSISIWAAVLGLTLGGLTIGYFFGGKLSKRFGKNPNLLFTILTIASILTIALPFIGRTIMEQTYLMPLEIGSIISLSVYMVPPLIFMGMVSPIIINQLTDDKKIAGNNAGNVYAISTVGGIITTFLLGFYLIPKFGLTTPCIFFGILLGIIPVFFLLKEKLLIGLSSLILILVMVFLSSFTSNNQYSDEYQIIYQSEGILGQIKVVDHPSYGISEDARIGRALIVNNTLQTYVDKQYDMSYSLWNWANYFPTAASIFPKGSKVLLLGLGGGTLVKQLRSLDFEVDVVEIDQRVVNISFKYFNLERNTPVIIDDARHYIKTTNKKYDIIIYDTFLSESVPEHLLTVQGIHDAEDILNPGGMVMANFYGAIEGKKGKAARSVLKTFQNNDFKVKILATPGSEVNRNLIFLSSKDEKDWSNTRYKSPNYETLENLPYYFLNYDNISLEDALLLEDEKPQLSKLYNPIAKEWKISYNRYYDVNFKK